MILRAWLLLSVLPLCAALGAPREALPNREPVRLPYQRDRWPAGAGLPAGGIQAIAQTADGYLWIGTDHALIRFDGFTFQDLSVAHGTRIEHVLALGANSAGHLWIRQRGHSLYSFHNGEFQDVLWTLRPREDTVTAFCVTPAGDLLFSGKFNGLLRYRNGGFETVAPASALPQSSIISLAETPDGRVWLGTSDAGLYLIERGRAVRLPGLANRRVNAILPTAAELWIATDKGVFKWTGTEISDRDVPPVLRSANVMALVLDRSANLWAGTRQGLIVTGRTGIVEIASPADAVNAAVNVLCQDRDGNIWVGGDQGIERFRESTFATYGRAQGLPSGRSGPVFAAAGRTWVAPSSGGLCSVEQGRVRCLNQPEIAGDLVYALTGHDDDLWLGLRGKGLAHVTAAGDSFLLRRFTERDGLAQNTVSSVYRSRDGSIWAGTLNHGVSRLVAGRFTNLTVADGLASNTVAAILEGADGTMWFGTSGGLSALSQGRWRTYGVAQGLPSDSVISLLADSAGTLWVGTTSGLAFLSNGGVTLPRNVPASLKEQTVGITEDRHGFLWIVTTNHVLRVSRHRLRTGALAEGDAREYGLADGLRSVEGVRRQNSLATGPDGRVWLSLNEGLSVVDPARLTNSTNPAAVHIDRLLADASNVELRPRVHLAPGPRRLSFNYTAVSLSGPERVRFRYVLEGYDHALSEPTAAREAEYTNLGPGPYRFRVLATNSEGHWNGGEASLEFTIEPWVWQTVTFRTALAVSLLGAVFVLYRLRVRRIAEQLNIRFEARLAERTRIAQELHDTLLQGFLSASMQIDVATDILPPDSPARPRFARALALMHRVIDEGRNTIRGLRSPVDDCLDLEHAFAQIQHEFASQSPASDVAFRVAVHGDPRPLQPVLRDELYRIGREALVNAFRHAQAGAIELTIAYSSRSLSMTVSDNGRGIDPSLLERGREGHWGLVGMRERASQIGASFKVMSSPSAGTEVQLKISGRLAYRPAAARDATRFRTLPPDDVESAASREHEPFAGSPRR